MFPRREKIFTKILRLFWILWFYVEFHEINIEENTVKNTEITGVDERSFFSSSGSFWKIIRRVKWRRRDVVGLVGLPSFLLKDFQEQ